MANAADLQAGNTAGGIAALGGSGRRRISAASERQRVIMTPFAGSAAANPLPLGSMN